MNPQRQTLGTWLSRLWTGIRGRVSHLFSRSRGPLSLEKVRTAGSFGAIQFLPQHDGITGETAEMRQEYRRMIRDESVKSALLRKIDQVAALEWQIHPEEETDSREKLAAKWLDWMTDRMEGGKPQIVHEILFGMLIEGHSICEKVWDFDPIAHGRWRGFHRLRAIKSKDIKYAQLTVDQFRNIIAVRGTAWNAGRLYDPRDFVISTHLPLWDNPQGMSDLRAAYRYYWIKDTLWKLRAIYLEKYAAGGMMKGKYKRNELRASLELALSKAKANTYVALPDGTEMDLVDLATRGGNDFEKAIEDCNQAITVSISGAFLQSLEGTTAQGAGNSETHKDTADLAVNRLSKAAAFVVMHQLFPDALQVNFGTGVNTPLLTLGAVDDADLQPSLSIDNFFVANNVPLSKKALYKRYRREEPEDEQDAVLKPQAQPGEGGGPPGMPGMPGMGGPPKPPAPHKPAGGGQGGWQRYAGPRGGHGWRDPHTGRKVYGSAPPSAHFSEKPGAAPLLALPGDDGAQAARLLRQAQAEGTRELGEIAGAAVRRLLSQGPERALSAQALFDGDEKVQLAQALAKVRATADLLGRCRVREQLTDSLAATAEE
ncbi:MAG: DUF935 family protein [Patescibacteria group bacterium]|nr:DUF935 family protein [Patescibacteria group bacterium]